MSSIEAHTSVHSEAEATGPGSLGRRILDTFVSPGELFSRLGTAPPWVDVLMVAALVTTAAMVLIPSEVWLESSREALNNMTDPRAREAMSAETMARYSRISAPIGAFIGTFLTAFIVAGLLKLVFGVMMGGEATFAQYRGVVSHAALISALGLVVTLPIWIVTGDMTTQLSAALLAPDLPKGVVRSLLQALAVFNIWWLAVVALGVAAVNRGKVSMAAAAGVIFGVFFAISAVAGLIAGR
ncbi:MAG TPA: YIP1 family protein [Longimicrobium sp.]|jgi:hypothetical protein